MKLNQYVRNGNVRRSAGMVVLFGTAKYDPRIRQTSYATIDGEPMPCAIPSEQIGQPHELIFHIAGDTYYPTLSGYEKL